MKGITPCLWFDRQAEEAARLYTSLLPNSRIVEVARYGKAAEAAAGMPAGSVMTVTFELQGQRFIALNGGPQFKFTEAVSFMVNCQTQKEVDELWGKLTEGGQEQPCGWLKDRYGLSWQIVPTILGEMLHDKDPKKSERVMAAMLKMRKIDVEALQRAYEGP